MKTLHPQKGVIETHLVALPLFRELSRVEVEALAQASLLRLYQRGEQLFAAGDEASELFYLVRGGIRVVGRLPDGREKVIHLQNEPGLVAEAPVLVGRPYPASVICNEECVLVVLPRQALLQATRTNPEIPWRLMGQLFERLRELTRSITEHSRKDAAGRLASFLLGASDEKGVVELPGPKKDVASYLGLRPESLSRALAVLQEQGAIAVDEQRIVITDREALVAATAIGES